MIKQQQQQQQQQKMQGVLYVQIVLFKLQDS